MSKKYTLTLYIAAPGTPLTDDKGQPLIKNGKQEHSMVGHVYYKISDGTKDGTTGYGFAPKKDGDPFGPGEVQRKEYEKYQNPIYERQLEISEEQYRRLSDYGAKHETLRQFNTATYNGLNNRCVDFTFVALKYAGIYQGRKASVYDDLGNEISYTDRSHEGTVKVVPNIREFEKIPAPFPNSPLNKTIHRDMPERTWLQKRLTENEQEQTYQYAQNPVPAADGAVFDLAGTKQFNRENWNKVQPHTVEPQQLSSQTAGESNPFLAYLKQNPVTPEDTERFMQSVRDYDNELKEQEMMAMQQSRGRTISMS